MKLKIKDEILKIAPYTPGKSKIAGVSNVIKLSSNENPIGCSPKVVEAYKNFNSFNRYPDATASELREAIGKVENLDSARLICGAGSDELLGIIANGFSTVGEENIYTRHGFLVYPIATQSAGATPISVPEKNYTTDADTILDAVNDKTRVVFVANPNNPTGTYISSKEMARLRAKLPESVLLVIDSAYAECADAKDYTDGRELVDANPDNTIMTRTFSKIYGLAALRLGWAYAGEKVIDIMNRVRPVFNLTYPTLQAGIAAINDREFVKKSVEYNAKWREKLFNELKKLGLDPLPSQANFVTANVGDGKKFFDHMASNGVIVREIANYKMPEFSRISIGTESEMAVLFKALASYKR